MLYKKEINKIKKGFAMLFAVLTASLLLTIGISIFGISFKELVLSTNARESQVAFYAADSARECALYWDVKRGAFPACLDSTCTIEYPPVSDQINYPTIDEVICAGGIKVLNRTKGNKNSTFSAPANTSFVKFGTSLDPEADVTVTKTYDSSNNKIKTTIKALGYNTELVGRRLERGIQQENEN